MAGSRRRFAIYSGQMDEPVALVPVNKRTPSVKLETFSHWAQIGATVFVGIGLFLVVFEMRQTHNLSNTEMTSVGLSEIVELHRSIGGEQFAQSIAKACLSPEKLTPAEYVVLDNYFEALYWTGNRAVFVNQIGEFGADSDALLLRYYQSIADSKYGRWWLQRKASSPSPTIRRDLIDEAIRLGKALECSEFYKEMMSVE